MKTFIWNTEFMVHIAVAETIADAREAVIERYSELYETRDYSFDMSDENMCIPPAPKIDELRKFVHTHFPIFLNEKDVINYYHANE